MSALCLISQKLWKNDNYFRILNILTLSDGIKWTSSGNKQSNLITVERVGLLPKPLGSVKRFFEVIDPNSPMLLRLFTSNLMKGRYTDMIPFDFKFLKPRILS